MYHLTVSVASAKSIFITTVSRFKLNIKILVQFCTTIQYKKNGSNYIVRTKLLNIHPFSGIQPHRET